RLAAVQAVLFALQRVGERGQLATEVDQVLVALGPIAEEREFLGDGRLRFRSRRFEREIRGGGKGVVHGHASGSLPAYALRRVLQENALVGELLADRVGTREIARGLGGDALVDQG